MKNFFSLVNVILVASTKGVEAFTAEIAKDGKALSVLVDVVKEVVPAMQESGVVETAKALQDAASVLDRTLSRMKYDVKLELASKLPRSSDFMAIRDCTKDSHPGDLAWVPKAELAASHGESLEELEESIAQEKKFLIEEINYVRDDLEEMSSNDPGRAKLQKKMEKAQNELARRFGIIA